MSFCRLLQVIPARGEHTLWNRFLRGLTDHCVCVSGIHQVMQQQCPNPPHLWRRLGAENLHQRKPAAKRVNSTHPGGVFLGFG